MSSRPVGGRGGEEEMVLCKQRAGAWTQLHLRGQQALAHTCVASRTRTRVPSACANGAVCRVACCSQGPVPKEPQPSTRTRLRVLGAGIELNSSLRASAGTEMPKESRCRAQSQIKASRPLCGHWVPTAERCFNCGGQGSINSTRARVPLQPPPSSPGAQLESEQAGLQIHWS